MEKNTCRFRRLMAAFLFALLVWFVSCTTGDPANLDKDLRTIRDTKRRGGIELAALERRCLSYLGDHNSPAEKGKIYSTVALMYSDRGYARGTDPNIPRKVIKYSEMALNHPLDPLLASQMYARCADAWLAQLRLDSKLQSINVREKVVDLCLKGLKLAIDANAPEEYPKSPPSVPRFDVPSDHALYQQLKEEHSRLVEAHEKWLDDVDLYWLRRQFFNRCVSLSSREPHNLQDFRDKVRLILNEHTDVADRLIIASQAEITSREELSRKPERKESVGDSQSDKIVRSPSKKEQ